MYLNYNLERETRLLDLGHHSQFEALHLSQHQIYICCGKGLDFGDTMSLSSIILLLKRIDGHKLIYFLK